EHFTVENARIYTLPETLPPIVVSAFGEASVALAARCGDGLVSTKPDAGLLEQYEQHGGRGPKLAQLKVVWAESVREAEDLAYKLRPTPGLEGELSQLLPTPAHLEQAGTPLHRDDVAGAL